VRHIFRMTRPTNFNLVYGWRTTTCISHRRHDLQGRKVTWSVWVVLAQCCTCVISNRLGHTVSAEAGGHTSCFISLITCHATKWAGNILMLGTVHGIYTVSFRFPASVCLQILNSNISGLDEATLFKFGKWIDYKSHPACRGKKIHPKGAYIVWVTWSFLGLSHAP